MSAVSGGSFKPEIASTSHASVMSPALTSSSHAANTAPTAAPEIDDGEYSVKPPSESWEKNGGSPQKGE